MKNIFKFFRNNLIIFIIPVVFLILGIFTIKDYGISWDEPVHFIRGQGYLNLFLTKDTVKTAYSPSKSYYENVSFPASYWMTSDSGHPPINGILAAASNYLFFQRLSILGDIESYQLFIVLCATLLVLIVSIYEYQVYGKLAAFVAALSLATYPLFFSESHFNIKDPPEATFFGLTLWAFWTSLKKGDARWLLLSMFSFYLAFGIKFDVLFMPFIILPYLFFRYKSNLSFKHLKKIPHKYIFILLISPLLVWGLLYSTWPFLWHNSFSHFMEILKYYKGIGTDTAHVNGYYIKGGFNLFAIYWIVTTTPPLVLLLALIGLIYAFKKTDKYYTSLLWLLWFIVPVIRVTMPNTSIYGGIRQIMEFIPGMALLSGLGAKVAVDKISKIINTAKIYPITLLILLFATQIIFLTKIHPNENVYFNSLVGGLSGATQKGIPYAGNSFGNAYKPAVEWINKHVETGAKVALLEGTSTNIPSFWFRNDINFDNLAWSGIKRNGEYIVELTYNNPVTVYQYAWDYVNNFLDPVYQVKVDGVAIVKVWRNDLAHTKKEWQLNEVLYKGLINLELKDRILTASIAEPQYLSKISFLYQNSSDCTGINGKIQYSMDGKNWIQMQEPIPFNQTSDFFDKESNMYNFYFAGEKALFVRYIADGDTSCILNHPEIQLTVLK